MIAVSCFELVYLSLNKNIVLYLGPLDFLSNVRECFDDNVDVITCQPTWIDQMIYLFDVPDSVYALVDKVSSLEIDSDDTVDIVATYHSGLIASIHLDLYTRPHEKEIKVYGDKGTITWQDDGDSSILTLSGESVETISFDEARNVMFDEGVIDFLRVVRRESPRQTCGLSAGYEVMKVIEASRERAKKREVVNLASIE
jgi:predicted dehydrogenase